MLMIYLVLWFHFREKCLCSRGTIPVHNLVAPFLLAVVIPGDRLRTQHLRHLHETAKMDTLTPSDRELLLNH